MDALLFDSAYFLAALILGTEEYLVFFNVYIPMWAMVVSVFLELSLACFCSVFMVRITYGFLGRTPSAAVKKILYALSAVVLMLFLAVIVLVFLKNACWKTVIFWGRDLMNLCVLLTVLACDICILARRRDILPGLESFSLVLVFISLFVIPPFVIANPLDIGIHDTHFPDMIMVGFFAMNIAFLLFSFHRRNTRDNRVLETRSANHAFERLSHLYNISEREYEILELVVQGKTNAQIAQLLFLSPHTVKNHLYNAYRKLDVANRMMLLQKLEE